MAFNPVKKKYVEQNAKLKTCSDYALVLHHINGIPKNDALELAIKSEAEPLFQELLERNIELFKTGDLVITI
jgi:hypothetical protein